MILFNKFEVFNLVKSFKFLKNNPNNNNGCFNNGTLRLNNKIYKKESIYFSKLLPLICPKTFSKSALLPERKI